MSQKLGSRALTGFQVRLLVAAVMSYDRIFLFGGTGSGKTTLARKLSSILKIPLYSTDEFVYNGNWKTKYSQEERENKIKTVLKKEKWIIEGVHDAEWIDSLFEKCSFVILLLPTRFAIFTRIIKRALKNREKGTPDSIRAVLKLIYWGFIYKRDSFIKHKHL
ncbi:MAG: hypothetical protein AABX71_00395, partial [Nanoarchaeota archaeon]